MIEDLANIVDTGERPASSDNLPSPEELAKRANEPATVAYVDKATQAYYAGCSARRTIRRWAIYLAAVIGGAAVANAGVVLWGRSVVRDTVRTEVRAALEDIYQGVQRKETSTRTTPRWTLVPSAMAAQSWPIAKDAGQ